MAVVVQIDTVNNDLVFTYDNLTKDVVQGPFILSKFGPASGNINNNNFYIIKGRDQKETRFGLAVTQIDGLPFTGTFDDLGDLVNTLIIQASSSAPSDLTSDDIVNVSPLEGLTVSDALLNAAKFPEKFYDDQTMNADPITGTINDYLPSETGKIYRDIQFIFLNPTNNVNIDGLLAPTSGSFDIKILFNNSTNRRIRLRNNRTTSAANNRFLFNGNITIQQKECAVLFYNYVLERWHCFAIYD